MPVLRRQADAVHALLPLVQAQGAEIVEDTIHARDLRALFRPGGYRVLAVLPVVHQEPLSTKPLTLEP
jgi:hypothetical protein